MIWDAVNDPIIGLLTDRMRSRLGRRRPFLLWFAVPFGISFVILWSAPQWGSQVALLIYVTLTYMLMDTLQSLIYVPYLALTPELASDYDERTSLTGFRSFFQLFGSLTVVLAAPNIVDRVLAAGFTQQQGYMLVGAIFGGISIIPLLLIAFFIRERATPQQTEALPLRETLHADVAEHPVPLWRGDTPAQLVRGGHGGGRVPLLSCCIGWRGETSLPPSACWDLTSPMSWRSSAS